MKASVVGLHGTLSGQRFPVGDVAVAFGRGEDCDIVIADPAVSRHHAELRQEADGFVLTDRGSSNGTRVNGVKITTQHLRPGDEITIATQRFTFEGIDAAAVTMPVTSLHTDRTRVGVQ